MPKSPKSVQHAPPLREDPERQEAFLQALRDGAIGPIEAARRASPHCIGPEGGYHTFRRLREEDPRFAAAWDEALEEGKARMKAELQELAIDRIKNPPKRPVYSNGEVVGWTEDVNAATKLHLRFLSKLDPEWSERRQHTHDGKVDHDVSVRAVRDPNVVEINARDFALLGEEKADQLLGLVAELRELRAADAPKQLEAASDE